MAGDKVEGRKSPVDFWGEGRDWARGRGILVAWEVRARAEECTTRRWLIRDGRTQGWLPWREEVTIRAEECTA